MARTAASFWVFLTLGSSTLRCLTSTFLGAAAFAGVFLTPRFGAVALRAGAAVFLTAFCFAVTFGLAAFRAGALAVLAFGFGRAGFAFNALDFADFTAVRALVLEVERLRPFARVLMECNVEGYYMLGGKQPPETNAELTIAQPPKSTRTRDLQVPETSLKTFQESLQLQHRKTLEGHCWLCYSAFRLQEVSKPQHQ